jgi:hypothetical protein
LPDSVIREVVDDLEAGLNLVKQHLAELLAHPQPPAVTEQAPIVSGVPVEPEPPVPEQSSGTEVVPVGKVENLPAVTPIPGPIETTPEPAVPAETAQSHDESKPEILAENLQEETDADAQKRRIPSREELHLFRSRVTKRKE